jgi:hypothetical protein
MLVTHWIALSAERKPFRQGSAAAATRRSNQLLHGYSGIKGAQLRHASVQVGRTKFPVQASGPTEEG